MYLIIFLLLYFRKSFASRAMKPLLFPVGSRYFPVGSRGREKIRRSGHSEIRRELEMAG